MHHSVLKIKDGNDGIIVGVSSLDQLKSNLTYLEKGPLPQEVVEKLDEAWEIVMPNAPKYDYSPPLSLSVVLTPAVVTAIGTWS